MLSFSSNKLIPDLILLDRCGWLPTRELPCQLTTKQVSAFRVSGHAVTQEFEICKIEGNRLIDLNVDDCLSYWRFIVVPVLQPRHPFWNFHACQLYPPSSC